MDANGGQGGASERIIAVTGTSRHSVPLFSIAVKDDSLPLQPAVLSFISQQEWLIRVHWRSLAVKKAFSVEFRSLVGTLPVGSQFVHALCLHWQHKWKDQDLRFNF